MKNFNTIIKRKNRKTISIKIIDSATIQISVPNNYSDKKIIGFINKHNLWIQKKLELTNIKEKQVQQLFNENHIQIPIFGIPTTVNFKLQNKEYFHKLLNPILENFISKYKNLIIENDVNFSYKISIFKSRWGSCNLKQKSLKKIKLNRFLLITLNQEKIFELKFNLLLLLLPEKLIEYVVIHEFCHILYMNHSKKFWNLVNIYCPEYKTINKELKSYDPYFKCLYEKLK